jgi:hypothetical protein
LQVNVTRLYNAANVRVPKSFVKHTDMIYNNTCSGVGPGSVSVLSFDSLPLVLISNLDIPEAIKLLKSTKSAGLDDIPGIITK